MDLMCPECEQRLQVTDEGTPSSVQCPGCGQVLTVADTSSDEVADGFYACSECGGAFSADSVYAEGDAYVCHGCHARRPGSESLGAAAASALASAGPTTARTGRARGNAPRRPVFTRPVVLLNILAALAMTGGVIWFFASDRNDLKEQVRAAEQSASTDTFEVAAAKFRDLASRADKGIPPGMVQPVRRALEQWHDLSRQRTEALRREMAELTPESACRLYPVLRRLKQEELVTEPYRPELDRQLNEVVGIFGRTRQLANQRAQAGNLPGAMSLFRQLYVIARKGDYPPEVGQTLEAAAGEWTALVETTVSQAEQKLARGPDPQARAQLQAVVDDAAGKVVPAEVADSIRKAQSLLARRS